MAKNELNKPCAHCGAKLEGAETEDTQVRPDHSELACDQPSIKSKISFFPFCSKRCQLLDLGGWITERYAIPTKEVPGLGEVEDPDN